MGIKSRLKRLRREAREREEKKQPPYVVNLDLQVHCDEGLPGLLVELYRRFGEDDGWMPQSIWGPHGGAFSQETIQKAFEEATPRIEELELPGRCALACTRKDGKIPCLGRIWMDGKPACRMSPDEIREAFKLIAELARLHEAQVAAEAGR